MRSRGFSLLELLITMALILILYVLLMSPGSKPHQERQKIACQTNLRNIHMALKIYAMENQDAFPATKDASSSEAPLSLLIPRYTTVTESFTCPGSRDAPLPEGEPFTNRKISYAYYMNHTAKDGADQPLLSDEQVNTEAKLTGQGLFSAGGKGPGSNHRGYGGNILFCDGHVEPAETKAPRDLPCPTGIVLLNPRP